MLHWLSSGLSDAVVRWLRLMFPSSDAPTYKPFYHVEGQPTQSDPQNKETFILKKVEETKICQCSSCTVGSSHKNG
jgi:hypothetical protein